MIFICVIVLILQVEVLEKGFMFGDVQVLVLCGLLLDIYFGELILVFGLFGCGKSMLLLLLFGLFVFDGGCVYVLGQDVGYMICSEVECFCLYYVGFVFQGFNLFLVLIVLEQVQLLLGYRGMCNCESELLVCRVLEEVGFSYCSYMCLVQLFGGEKQCVVVVCVFVKLLMLIFVDEFISVLDVENGQCVIDILYCYVWVYGVIVLCVSYDLCLIWYVDWVIVMEDGMVCDDCCQNEIVEFVL